VIIMATIKKRKSKIFGKAFLGKNAYKEVELEAGFKPPTKGHEKPFDYKLYNTLRRMGRIKK